MPKVRRLDTRRRLAAAISLYVLNFLRMVTVVAWFYKRSRIRRRIMGTTLYNTKRVRECWTKRDLSERFQCWWDTTVPLFNDEQWVRHFRMTQEMFWEVVSHVEEDMRPGAVHIREPIPIEKRVAIALFCLATGGEFKKVGPLFGVHGGSVYHYLHRFCQSLVQRARSEHIRWPSDETASETASRIEAAWKCPNLFGIMAGAHFAIKAPEKRRTPNHNSTGGASCMAQAVVDDKYRFLDAEILPGGLQKSEALAQSGLYRMVENFPKVKKTLGDAEVPLMLGGGIEYPLLPWLLTPYGGRHHTPEQESFNIHINNARLYALTAFRRLRSRWQILQRKIILSPDSVPRTIEACCILHNMCEAASTPVLAEWQELTDLLQPVDKPCKEVSGSAAAVRDTICKHLANNHPLVKKDILVVDWMEPTDEDSESSIEDAEEWRTEDAR